MKKILIIEDDQIVANIYRNKFSVEGYSVEIAHDGHSGVESIRSFRPDAVILDLMLPKITGVEVMKTVRAEPDFQKLPIIVFSNTYLSNMVQEAWKAGATKCLSKANCSPKQLIEVVRSTLSTPAATASSAPSKTSTPEQQTAAGTPTRNEQDAQFQAELRKTFVEGLPVTLSGLRSMLLGMSKGDEPSRVKQVQEMYRRIHGITSNAGLAGMVLIAQMADALEALLKELAEKPKNLNASTLRTVASAVDFLGVLFEQPASRNMNELPPVNILVVDDEAISRRAVTYALEKAKLKSVNVEDPQIALNLLQESKFDLIFLDVDMPGMNGYELCAKLRLLPTHKKTPVVFVTGLNDLESRANSMMSGGTDFIAKPFLFMELAVKALVHTLRGWLALAS